MRDDFTTPVKESLAKRVGMRCSNPECRQATSGPQLDPRKSVNVGVAAHITAAASGGPRFDGATTPDDRSSIANGIWLCQKCAKLVDNDESRYTADTLRAWKQQAEEHALAEVTGGPSPALDGKGGSGGHARSEGLESVAIGGKGGKGGGLGGSQGGIGGDAVAVGRASIAIGGNGGDGSRADGRGGRGGASPLKNFSPEFLKSWGLTGNEGYGRGGDAPNTPTYDQRLRILCSLSAEYASFPDSGPIAAMPGVLMPPVDWVNARLVENDEDFRVELIDGGSDFLLVDAKQ